MNSLQINTELQNGKYRIIRFLGQGGFGITYLAEHTMLDKMVAIKEFFPKDYCDRDETTSHLTIGTKNSIEIVDMLKTKFIKEARNISKLHHNNIITIYDIFQENDTAYYVMEYVDGLSLSELIKQKGAMTEAIALGYIRKIAEAVGYMHSLSMNHLDLKPANIMIREYDNEPVLIDFGLSKQYDASGGQTSTTPVGINHGYAPIEQYRPGGVSTFTPQTDIYALGATLFALLTGKTPPHYSDILEDSLPELPVSVSQSCANAIEHAMEIKKNKRPESVAEFLTELSSVSSTSNKSTWQAKHVTTQKSEKTILINPTVSKPSPETSYDTVIISEYSQKSRDKSKENNTKIDNLEFIDLGLSVKWASHNIGANAICDAGTYFERNQDGNIYEIYEWNLKGAKVPTMDQFRELIEKCRWIWTNENGFFGYRIIGPNSNSIYFGVTGEGGMKKTDLDFVNYGILWTNESLQNGNQSKSMVLYFNPETYKLIYYPLFNKRPIRLITE